MKITKSKLNQIIKEEIEQLARGRSNISLSRGQAQNIRQTQNRAKKIIKFLISDDPDYVNQGLSILDDLEDQQLIDTISNHFVLSPDGTIVSRGFEIPETTFGMLLSYFAEKSDRVKNIMKQIESLNLRFDNFITNVDFLRFCANLTVLDLYICTSLENVDGLEGCTNLTTLNLGRCTSLQNVDGLEGCTNLNWLGLNECSSLENVDGLQGLTNLRTLYLSECNSLENVDGLKECTNLMALDLPGCVSLQNVDVLKGLTNLWSLNLYRCELLPPELQKYFVTDSSGTAYEKFMKALNASKGNQT